MDLARPGTKESSILSSEIRCAMVGVELLGKTATRGPVGDVVAATTLVMGAAWCVVSNVLIGVGGATGSADAWTALNEVEGLTSPFGLTLGAGGMVLDGERGLKLGSDLGGLIEGSHDAATDIGEKKWGHLLGDDYNLIKDGQEFLKDLLKGGSGEQKDQKDQNESSPQQDALPALRLGSVDPPGGGDSDRGGYGLAGDRDTGGGREYAGPDHFGGGDDGRGGDGGDGGTGWA